MLCLLLLIACRSETSDQAITKPQLREKLEEMQALNSGDISAQFSKKDDQFKEKVALQILDNLDEATLKKLMQEPRFKELLKKLADEAKENLKKDLEDFETKEIQTFEPLKITVSRKMGLKINKSLALADPYLKYQVRSGARKKIKCDDLSETSAYWDDFIALQKNQNLLLGITPAVFEQYTKSCLLFYRLRASMEKCQDSHLETLARLCRVDEEQAQNEQDEEDSERSED